MPGFAELGRSRPIEYYMLHDATPSGRSVGFYAGKYIAKVVVDGFGQRYVYVGLAPRRCDGKFDVAALKTGECILQPGLVYRHMRVKKSWWQSLRTLSYGGSDSRDCRSIEISCNFRSTNPTRPST